MKYLSSFNIWAFIALNIGFIIPIDSVNAIPTTKGQHCVEPLKLPVDGQLYTQNENKKTRINIRERPNVSSKILYVTYPDNSVIIHRQANGNDGYCWYMVKIYNQPIQGWVRGDLVDVYLD